MDDKTWKEIINEWNPPTIKDDDDSEYVKPGKDGTYVEDEDALGSYHFHNSIYNGVYKNIVRGMNH